MCTGYTNKIEDGTIKSPKEFLKLCLREFGVLIHMREESLGAKIDPDWDAITKEATKYYVEMIEKYKAQIERYSNPSSSEIDRIKKEMKDKYENEIEYYKKSLEKSRKKNAMYDSYVESISQWECSDEFKPVREFAINQCNMSKDSVKYQEEAIEQYTNALKNIDGTVSQYIEEEIKNNKEWLAKEEEEVRKATERIMERKKFYERFMKEVESVK